MNTPYAASNVHLAPLSEVNDGCNDLICLTAANGGKFTMAKLLLAIDEGEYYDVNENGDIERNVPIDYIKASTWELRPRVKAPRPLGPEHLET
mmetsp:Transcript_34250/g.42326  ORF Transcript_34250/g.42326 Transcript_34250/m.42326 type:complete len:93 (+) Transcript_34250:1175-1453(+)|eukprot:CAMPEP_0170478086 /NCGR_PEP_ID=MMETSP0123-20130129/19209_1 /TAXON_ID=182087 /ORGANISM="Favella ehrenbergii, Strain Fehren 1" /LENGTH=92 /DNA_ID=CAMNT_0010750189 /DNA_START=1166 /DNA_END=1444 /DNA_ORIENTATION=+